MSPHQDAARAIDQADATMADVDRLLTLVRVAHALAPEPPAPCPAYQRVLDRLDGIRDGRHVG